MGGVERVERVARTACRVRRSGFAFAAGLLLLATVACGGDGATEPLEDALTDEEVEFLAAEADAELGAALEGAMSEQAAAIGEGEAAVVAEPAATVGGPAATGEPAPAAQPSLATSLASSAAEPIQRAFEFQRTVVCPEGGAVGVGGAGTVTVDPEAGSVEIAVEGSQELVTCARARGDLLLTVDGTATFTARRERVRGSLVELVHDLEGAFEVTTSDGREAACSFDLHAELDGNVVRITGDFCGREVDRRRPVD